MSRLLPEFNDTDRAAFIAGARELLTANPREPGAAVTFRHQGRTVRGMDCIGVLVWAANAAGFEVNDRTDYGKLPAKRKLSASLTAHFDAPVATAPVTLADLRVGDVVAMAWGDEESHVAIVVDHPEGLGVVHAYLSAGRVIEHRIDEHFLRQVEEVYRP